MEIEDILNENWVVTSLKPTSKKQALQELAARYGSRFTPDPGWERLRQPR